MKSIELAGIASMLCMIMCSTIVAEEMDLHGAYDIYSEHPPDDLEKLSHINASDLAMEELTAWKVKNGVSHWSDWNKDEEYKGGWGRPEKGRYIVQCHNSCECKCGKGDYLISGSACCPLVNGQELKAKWESMGGSWTWAPWIAEASSSSWGNTDILERRLPVVNQHIKRVRSWMGWGEFEVKQCFHAHCECPMKFLNRYVQSATGADRQAFLEAIDKKYTHPEKVSIICERCKKCEQEIDLKIAKKSGKPPQEWDGKPEVSDWL